MNIAGLGLINKDIVAVVPFWERDIKVAATRYFEQVGGPVPVALMAMARLGPVPVYFLGVTGSDRDADDLTIVLEREGIVPLLQRAPGIATSRSLALLDARDGSRTLANYAEELPPRILTGSDSTLLKEAGLLHLDGRDLPASLAAAETVRSAGGTVSLDLGTMRPGREALLRLCDIVIASKKGGAGAFPMCPDDPGEQVRQFLGMGIEVAAVTLGAEGVVLGWEGGDPIHLPAYRVPRVVDTCGAGDLFHGAFLFAYLQGQSPLECARFAQAAVAIRITRYGNENGLPSLDEVTQRLRG